MTYEALVNEVKSYKDSVVEVGKLREKRKLLMYKLSGLKGADPSKEPSQTHNDEAIMQMKLSIIEEIGEIDDEIHRLDKNIEHTETIFLKLEPRCVQALCDIFIRGVSFEKEAADLGFCWGSGLKRFIELNIRERL